MIVVDDRTGSVELVRHLPKDQCVVKRLEFGDFCWEGRGPEGVPWMIGVERKTVNDLLSCIATNRFTDHQLPGMLSTYNVSYLMLEGLVKYDLSDGVVKSYHGGEWVPAGFGARQFHVTEVLGFLNSLAIMTGIHVWQTQSERETAAYLLAFHRWWTQKEFDAHKSHLQSGHKATPLITRMSMLRRWASELPGIGYGKSGLVERHFKSPIAMVNSTIEDWLEIPKIGKVIAANVIDIIRKEI